MSAVNPISRAAACGQVVRRAGSVGMVGFSGLHHVERDRDGPGVLESVEASWCVVRFRLRLVEAERFEEAFIRALRTIWHNRWSLRSSIRISRRAHHGRSESVVVAGRGMVAVVFVLLKFPIPAASRKRPPPWPIPGRPAIPASPGISGPGCPRRTAATRCRFAGQTCIASGPGEPEVGPNNAGCLGLPGLLPGF